MPPEIGGALIGGLVTTILFIIGIVMRLSGVSKQGIMSPSSNSNGHVKWKELSSHCDAKTAAIHAAIDTVGERIEKRVDKLEEYLRPELKELDCRIDELEKVYGD